MKSVHHEHITVQCTVYSAQGRKGQGRGRLLGKDDSWSFTILLQHAPLKINLPVMELVGDEKYPSAVSSVPPPPLSLPSAELLSESESGPLLGPLRPSEPLVLVSVRPENRTDLRCAVVFCRRDDERWRADAADGRCCRRGGRTGTDSPERRTGTGSTDRRVDSERDGVFCIWTHKEELSFVVQYIVILYE